MEVKGILNVTDGNGKRRKFRGRRGKATRRGERIPLGMKEGVHVLYEHWARVGLGVLVL